MKRYEITKNCVKCGVCVDTCPIGCISMEEEQCVIDEETCVRCGSCYGVCGFGAILETEDR